LGHSTRTVKQMLYILGGVAGCLAIGVVGWLGFAMWQFERPPFPLSRLEQLRSTMTTNEVQQLLGAPAAEWSRTNDTGQVYSEWAYWRSSSWPIVYVYFSPDGTFERHVYDR
jgi:hypothetical protein